MTKIRATSRFKVVVKFSPTPMTQAEWEASEDLLARMVARMIAADHPEWFGENAA